MQVFGATCSELLRLAEKGKIDDRPHLLSLARGYFQPLADQGIDTLILGCTDLTCVRDIAEEAAGQHVTVVDPAEEVVREARQLLQEGGGLRSGQQGPPVYRFLITGDDQDNFAAFTARFMGLPGVQVQRVALPDVEAAGGQCPQSI
jgi:glutamate racemase